MPEAQPSLPPRKAGGLTPVEEVLRSSGGSRDLRRLPRLGWQAFGLVWAAAPRHLLLAGGLQVVAGLALAAQLLVIRRVLLNADVEEGVPDLGALTPELTLFGVLLVVVALSAVAQREQQRTLGELVSKYTTGRVLDVSTSVELIEYDRPSFYDRLQRARVNASLRPLQIANGVLGLIGGSVAVVAVGATLLLIEPFVVLLIVLGGLPAIALNRLASRATHAFAVEQTPRDRRRGYLYQTLSRKEEAQEVRAFGTASYLRGQHDLLFDERISDLKRLVRKRITYGVLAGVVGALVTVGAIVMLLAFVRTGRIVPGEAAVALGGVILIAGQIRGLVGSTGSLYEGALFLEDFTDFVRLVPPTAVADDSEALAQAHKGGFHRITLREVGFTYPSRTAPSLQGISLEVSRGEVIALVGENGSGKTTLTKLLAGLYLPSEGSIEWDGRQVEDIDPRELRQDVTVIFQDFAKYFLSAHQNVAISRVRHLEDRARVLDAARRAGADAFLGSMPGGYDTLLGPAFAGGSDLSIGQWQRVALARAYFRDAPMLILDEPTAAIDPRGEYEIFQQVRRLAEGRTVVLVSHRFSSVRAADRILVLDGGRIVEQGHHEELLAEDGLYAELFRLQAEGYRAAT